MKYHTSCRAKKTIYIQNTRQSRQGPKHFLPDNKADGTSSVDIPPFHTHQDIDRYMKPLPIAEWYRSQPVVCVSLVVWWKLWLPAHDCFTAVV